MNDFRMSLDEFTEITAPLYRQFGGFMPAGEQAAHKVDRYHYLCRLRPEALRVAVSDALATEGKMPTIAELERRANQWTIAQEAAGCSPRILSEQCPHCVATIGVYPSGRLGVRHESNCWYFNADVGPLPEAETPSTLREALSALHETDGGRAC